MVVDSSVWVELLIRGPLREKCEKQMRGSTCFVPTICIFEVYKYFKSRVSEDMALEATGFLSSHEVVDLTRDIGLLGADLSIQHELAMADSLILAHAHHLGVDLLTLDNDYAGLPRVRLIR